MDEKRQEIVMGLILDILTPYINNKHPRALWLKTSLPNLGESNLSDEDYEVRWRSLLKESANPSLFF